MRIPDAASVTSIWIFATQIILIKGSNVLKMMKDSNKTPNLVVFGKG